MMYFNIKQSDCIIWLPLKSWKTEESLPQRDKSHRHLVDSEMEFLILHTDYLHSVSVVPRNFDLLLSLPEIYALQNYHYLMRKMMNQNHRSL